MGGRPPGSKNKTTLLKEQRRAIFEEEVSEKWRDIISKLRPEYIADQFLGKAPDKIELKGEVRIDDKALDEAARLYGALVIKKKVNGEEI